MTALELLSSLVRVIFLILAVVTLYDFLRRPNAIRLEIAVLFGCFAPSDFEQFSEAVRSIGLYWLLLNQPPPGG